MKIDSLAANQADSTTPQLAIDSALVLNDSLAVKPVVVQKPIPPKIEYRTSIFKDHNLQQEHKIGLIRNSVREEWLIAVLVIVIAIIAYLRVSYYKRFTQLIAASFDYQLSSQLVREESILTQRVSLFLTGIFWISVSLLVSQSLKFYGLIPLGLSQFGAFGLMMLLVMTIYTVKILFIRLIGSILEVQKETESYVFNLFLYNKLSGLILLPLVILIRIMPPGYSKAMFALAAGVLVLGFISRVFRGFAIGMAKKGVSVIHLVLYFCTLEILPVLLMTKFLSEQLN